MFAYDQIKETNGIDLGIKAGEPNICLLAHWRSSHYQATQVRNKSSNIQGRSPNVVKVILKTITAHKGKNLLPPGANSFF